MDPRRLVEARSGEEDRWLGQPGKPATPMEVQRQLLARVAIRHAIDLCRGGGCDRGRSARLQIDAKMVIIALEDPAEMDEGEACAAWVGRVVIAHTPKLKRRHGMGADGPGGACDTVEG